MHPDPPLQEADNGSQADQARVKASQGAWPWQGHAHGARMARRRRRRSRERAKQGRRGWANSRTACSTARRSTPQRPTARKGSERAAPAKEARRRRSYGGESAGWGTESKEEGEGKVLARWIEKRLTEGGRLRRPAASKLGGGGGNGGKGLGFGEQGAPAYKGEEGGEGLGGRVGVRPRWPSQRAPPPLLPNPWRAGTGEEKMGADRWGPRKKNNGGSSKLKNRLFPSSKIHQIFTRAR